ncbi:hypothetical protein ACFL2D_02960 [Patescibacteria group bacterium]
MIRDKNHIIWTPFDLLIPSRQISALEKNDPPPNPVRNEQMILFVRVMHGVIVGMYCGCIMLIYYSGVTQKLTYYAMIAAGLLLLEGLVLMINRGTCPLTIVHRQFGDDKGFFDIFVPKQYIHYVTPAFAAVALVGILLLIV